MAPDDYDPTPEDIEDVTEAEEVPDAEGADPDPSSQLEDSLDDLRDLAAGLAAKLLGPKAARGMAIDPEKPVLSAEADKVIEDLGASLGRVLEAAGDGLRRSTAAGRENPAATPPADPQADAAEDDSLEGWSPLVLGARSLATGLGAVAAELADKLMNVPPEGSPPGDAEE